jgi:hypothetical protein
MNSSVNGVDGISPGGGGGGVCAEGGNYSKTGGKGASGKVVIYF